MGVSLLNLKRILGSGSLCLAVILSTLPSLALTVQEVPNPRQVNGGWVTDMANILQPETESQLNQIIDQLEAKNGAEIAVVTVPETAPAASPKAFTTELFNYWGIGKKGEDNGVLFLISVKDRRVEIETGYGVEGILPDAKVGNIIDTQIIPQFKQKDFDGGALAGTRAIVVILEPSLSKKLSYQNKDLSRQNSEQLYREKGFGGRMESLFKKIFVPMLLIFWIGLFLVMTKGIGRGSGSGGGSGSSGGGFSSGGSSGGGGFGGGGSGGGGSGGSW